MTKLTLYQTVSKIPSHNGWKMFTIGLFLVNYGGDTKSQLGTTRRLVKLTLVKKHLRILKTGIKNKTCLILGSQVLYGHFQLWFGQILTQKTSSVTSQLIL